MTSLYRIEELSDVFVDSCLRDASGRLLFMSCYGRDATIQQMLSAFSLPVSQGGLTDFRLAGGDGSHRVEVGDPDRLAKHTGRLPKENLFGNLVHAWIFDPRLQQPDLSSRVAWLVDRREELSHEKLDDRLWELYRRLSPVPLLDHWQQHLLGATPEYVTSLDEIPSFAPLGVLTGYRVELGDSFLDKVTELVRSRVLTLQSFN